MRKYLPILLMAPLLASCGLAAPNNNQNITGAAPLRTSTAPPVATATLLPPTVTPSIPATSLPATAVPATSLPAAPVPPASLPATTVPVSQTQAASTRLGRVLFLRDGALWTHHLATGQETLLAEQTREFAAAPDGRVAVVRVVEGQTDLWLMLPTEGGQLVQLTDDTRAEATPSWAPDGTALVFASGDAQPPDLAAPDWFSWSAWCIASEVRRMELPSRELLALGAGCDPAFSPDGRRIAFATPPQQRESGYTDRVAGIQNSIRLVNRQGKNGWNFAVAPGDQERGRLVFAPAWSPDGANIAFHRFVGYQALADIVHTEMAAAHKGGGTLLGSGAGWRRRPVFSPDGTLLAIEQHNYSDARGIGGYETWSVGVLRLGEAGSVSLPDGNKPTAANEIARITRAQSAAWHPEGGELALLLPVGWGADAAPGTFDQVQSGEVHRWTEQEGIGNLLADQVDFGSSLEWAP